MLQSWRLDAKSSILTETGLKVMRQSSRLDVKSCILTEMGVIKSCFGPPVLM